MKAMILAAGLGTRLQPLTQNTPKALVLIHRQPLIAYSLKLLKKYGFKEVLINLHHLGELIEKELGDGRKLGLKLTYSWEPTLLGTGGGIKKAQSFFGSQTFLVLNSDILLDLNLKQLLQFHKKKKGIATMVVRPREPDSPYTPILLGSTNRVLEIGSAKAAPKGSSVTYTGLQVLEPRFLDYLPENQESCIVRQGYQSALEAKEKIYGFLYEGYWNDLGTLARYRQAESDLKSEKIKFSYLNQS